jgi:hypothetical protein
MACYATAFPDSGWSYKAQLKLIEEIKGKYERGAKYYRISTYGRRQVLSLKSVVI